MKGKRTDSKVTGARSDTVGSAIADFIRTRSEAGQLAAASEIFEALDGKGLTGPGGEERYQAFKTLLDETIKTHDDLKEISGAKKIPQYYSVLKMAESYAQILARKGGHPTLLIAEVIRENSQKYPRPVPLELFEGPPFDLTPDEILSCLKEMVGSKDYQDIAQTTSSIGTVFLFSRQYLEPDYASMLAEWIDVGQAKSP